MQQTGGQGGRRQVGDVRPSGRDQDEWLFTRLNGGNKNMHKMHTKQTPNNTSLKSKQIMDSVSRGRLRHCEKTRKVGKERERETFLLIATPVPDKLPITFNFQP